MRTFLGVVVSDKMTKTAIVALERKTHHPLYKKTMILKKKLHAENSLGAKVGQEVIIAETKPIAKTVSFKIIKINEKQGDKK